ncbi:LCP family protein, partial [Actinotalea sp.]|uniref:LCP family protein n=1 Tax=Actinotalea sp. TaxID=1872145 RepID=UPI003566A07E
RPPAPARAATPPPPRPVTVRPASMSPVAQGGAPAPPAAYAPVPGGRPSRRRRVVVLVAAVLALLLAWPVGLALWANGKVQHVSALSGAADTPGTTYLLAGSDSRGEGGIPEDGTEGARTDTIMVLQVPASGTTSLISLPRDTYVDIPGHGPAKLNAAFSLGGAPLLVSTVEQITGLTVDHYVEIGLGGVASIVDAVGGVELCMDPAVDKVTFPVNDPDSGLVWEAPGCRVVDGTTALAYARMRKADLEGDIGRARRQQLLISAVTSQVAEPSLVLRPGRQVDLVDAGTGALVVSDGTGAVDLARLALAFRTATGTEGVRGTPPISNPDYRPGGIGSTVQLDPDAAPTFWTAVRDGSLDAGAVGGLPGT